MLNIVTGFGSGLETVLVERESADRGYNLGVWEHTGGCQNVRNGD